jgi:hypothetical protein
MKPGFPRVRHRAIGLAPSVAGAAKGIDLPQ